MTGVPASAKNRHRRILGRTAAAHDDARDAADDARQLLDAAIVSAAADAGLSSREIAGIVGLSHATVAAVVRRAGAGVR